jgi:hypothetical protein
MLTLILAVATVLGFVITSAGLIAVFVSARREYREAGARIETMRRLAREEKAEHNLVDGQAANAGDLNSEINARYEVIYANHDLVRPSLGLVGYQSAHESQRLLGLVLDSTRRDFAIAIVGLLVSTVASVWSLFI